MADDDDRCEWVNAHLSSPRLMAIKQLLCVVCCMTSIYYNFITVYSTLKCQLIDHIPLCHSQLLPVSRFSKFNFVVQKVNADNFHHSTEHNSIIQTYCATA